LGPKTRGAFEVLGKSRVLRAAQILTKLALWTAWALYALALQVALALAQLCGNMIVRGLRRMLLL